LEISVKVTAEKIPESRVLLRIEIPPEQVSDAIEKTYRDLGRRIRIPGFRPGKAPRALVERYVGGAETVQQEGIDRLIDESYRKALRDTDTHPIAEPDLSERPEFHPGEPLVIQATVAVAPTVELGDYQTIRMPAVQVEPTWEQVNSLVDEIRESNAEWTPVQRGIQKGDHAVIDVLGVAGTVPTLFGPTGEALLQTEGGKEVYNVKEHEHEVNPEGPVEFAPGFDEELIGLIGGSEKRFGLTLPADFREADLANKSIIFTVKVHEVKEKHLPAIDDEFAKRVGGGDTVEQLREAVRQQLQDRMQREARMAHEDALVEAVVSRSQIAIPEVMIERQIDSEIDDLKSDLQREKIGWQEYLASRQRSEGALRADYREPAIRTLRSYLVLREIARREGIEVRPEEVQEQIDQTAAQFGRASSIIRERLSTREQRERIESRIFYRKTVQRLAEIAQQEASEGASAAAGAAASETTASTEEPAAESTPAETAVAPEATESLAPTTEETNANG
jgi:trigger factor